MKIMYKCVAHRINKYFHTQKYLTAAEYITGSGLDVKVFENSNRLVSGLF